MTSEVSLSAYLKEEKYRYLILFQLFSAHDFISKVILFLKEVHLDLRKFVLENKTKILTKKITFILISQSTL